MREVRSWTLSPLFGCQLTLNFEQLIWHTSLFSGLNGCIANSLLHWSSSFTRPLAQRQIFFLCSCQIAHQNLSLLILAGIIRIIRENDVCTTVVNFRHFEEAISDMVCVCVKERICLIKQQEMFPPPSPFFWNLTSAYRWFHQLLSENLRR